ncbi:hypothetical protein LEP1GSC133_3818 [Leptospira borgpetersenii serovar Pomona str. 200901868]|uniref:Uncharacterized protein n=1 Tax=Leptospira borgpetersenii serovar Pomona str. 200901868 TaxID=1192866 RepID=M6WH39_LEPBO|nr:hypothetical protein LEP1GSC133_3818 [Leptospira borgpetersenii serovar Pomona str. 200901868]
MQKLIFFSKTDIFTHFRRILAFFRNSNFILFFKKIDSY